jgi:putative sigma-54 modulation protein
MKTDIQTVNFDAPNTLVQFIENELYDLETEFDTIVGAEVYLRPGKSEADNKTVKLKLNVPGPDLFAEYTASSYEGGLTEAIEKIRFQLNKAAQRRDWKR